METNAPIRKLVHPIRSPALVPNPQTLLHAYFRVSRSSSSFNGIMAKLDEMSLMA
jgi:hypothetical protein